MRQVKLAQLGCRPPQANHRDLVKIQIREQVFKRRNGVKVSSRVGQIQSDSAVPGALGDAHSCPQLPESFQSRVNQHGVCVDGGARIELHQIWLENDTL